MMICEQRESHGNVWEKSITDRGPEARARRPQSGGDGAAGNKVKEGIGIIGWPCKHFKYFGFNQSKVGTQ